MADKLDDRDFLGTSLPENEASQYRDSIDGLRELNNFKANSLQIGAQEISMAGLVGHFSNRCIVKNVFNESILLFSYSTHHICWIKGSSFLTKKYCHFNFRRMNGNFIKEVWRNMFSGLEQLESM